MGSTAPRSAWCSWKKKTLSLRDVSKPKVSYTGQPAHLHRANVRIKRKVSWWTLMATATAFQVPIPFSTVIRNPWKGLTLTRGGRFRWHLSIPQRRSWTCVRRPSTSVPRNWRFTFLFCSCNQERNRCCATCKCQTRARFGKKEAYQLPSKSEQRNYFRSTERTTFISLHELCTLCSRAFRCPPPFCARTFDE